MSTDEREKRCRKIPARGSTSCSAAKCRGFTLVELVVGAGLFGVILLITGMVCSAGRNAYQASTQQSRAESKARRGVDRAASEMLGLGGGLMFPDPSRAGGADSLTFQEPQGLAGANVVWGAPARIEREYAPGETDNGVDDDGDGLVDEGILVFTRDVGGANQRRVILCTGIPEMLAGEITNGVDDNGNGVIDERGFNLHLAAGVMDVRLSVEEPGPGGRTLVRTVETSFRLRN